MSFQFNAADVSALLPVLILAGGACLVLVFDLFLPRTQGSRSFVHGGTLILLLVAMYVSFSQYSTKAVEEVGRAMSPFMQEAWNHRMQTIVASLVFQGLTLLTLLGSGSFLEEEDLPYYGEYHALLLLFPVGTTLLVAAKNLMLAFIGLEIFSVALYILVAMRRRRMEAVEAGLKYFLLGAFAAAIFLYGAALIYAGNGTLDIPEVGPISRPGVPAPTGLAALGGALLFIALFFKASVAPFHMWTPDVYQGAPTPITALMSTGTKAAAFVILFLVGKLIPREILPLIPVLAVLTILVGNLGALVQTDIKRLLAYSGIAHAGYILIAFCVLVLGTRDGATSQAFRAMLFYVVTYGITNLAALGVIAYLERAEPRVLTLDGLRGLSRRNPVCASILGLAALSLGGIPPTAGFWGKYQVFSVAIQYEMHILAVLGIVFSVIGLYYYLKIVVFAFFLPADREEGPIAASGIGARVVLAVTGALIVIVGIRPDLLLQKLTMIKL